MFKGGNGLYHIISYSALDILPVHPNFPSANFCILAMQSPYLTVQETEFQVWRGMCHEHDWLMKYNYLFCLVQSMESRANFYGSENLLRKNEKSQNN